MSNSILARVVFRALIRQSRVASDGGFVIREPVDIGSFRRHPSYRYRTPAHLQSEALAAGLSLGLVHPPRAGGLTADELRDCIRANFRANENVPTVQQGALLDQAMGAMQAMNQQSELAECSSEITAQGVRVNVTSALVEMEPPSAYKPGASYLFTYRVRLEAVGDERVQLLGRQWNIRDARGVIVGQVPRGSSGVVGQTPLLVPGSLTRSTFEYFSSALLDTPTGSMDGSFQMVAPEQDGRLARHFDAPVAPFKLIAK